MNTNRVYFSLALKTLGTKYCFVYKLYIDVSLFSYLTFTQAIFLKYSTASVMYQRTVQHPDIDKYGNRILCTVFNTTGIELF